MQVPFDPKHPRPMVLLNQRCCFSDKELSEILATSDKDFGFYEYRTLFTIARCVGTYEELVYFLPRALEYIKHNPDDGPECMSQIIHFVSSEAESLGQDNLTHMCRNEIWLWFKQWTKTFSVQHYDQQACKQKGWSIEYDDIVENSQKVSELIDELIRYETHADLAEKMIQSLAEGYTEIHSAWLLEYAYQAREGYGILEANSNAEIRQLVTDIHLLQSHYDRIATTLVKQEDSPTYWLDICKTMRLKSA